MRIIRFIKNNIIMTVLLIVLLVGQALCMVELPEYVSKIVDIGIRNQGIEHAVPLRIRASEKNKTKFFIKDESIWSNFTVQEINGEKIYILNEDVDIESLNYEFARALIGVRLINKGDKIKVEDINAYIYGDIAHKLNITLKVMTTEQIIVTLEKMQPKDIKLVNEIIDEKLELLTEAEMVQVVSKYLANEYEVCGINGIQKMYMLKTIGQMMLITVILFAISIIQTYVMNAYATKFSEDTRNEMFVNIISDTDELGSKKSIASLINRTMYDTQLIEKAVQYVLMLSVYVPVLLLGTYFKVKKISNGFESLVLAVVIIGGIIGIFSYLMLLPKNKYKQKQLDKMNLIERESLNNLFIIRNTGKDKQLRKFEESNKELMDVTTNIFEFKYLITILVVLVANISGAYVLWQGGIKINLGVIGVGALMAVLDYLFQMSLVCSSIFKSVIETVSGYVSYNRCKEVLDKTKKTATKGITIENINKIEFKEVCFKYNNDDYILNKFSLVINPKEKILLKGLSGTGKSTVVKLLLKLYKIESGKILINDIDIEEIDPVSLRGRVGIVLQQNDIFYGTAKHNVLLGNTISDERLNKITEIAEITDIMSEDKNVGYKGKNISGGQRQRVAIARAIASNPDVLILDNAFSSVDENTKMNISRKLEEEFKEKIIITIEKEKDTCFENIRIVEM